MKYFITGSRGFIGRSLCHSVGSSNHFGYDLKDSILNNVAYRNHLSIKLVEYQPDVVVHLAALSGVMDCVDNPVEGFTHNVQGAFNVLESARELNIKRVIMASSGAAKTCTTPYHVHKRFIEDYCLASYLSYGVNSCALRFSNVYGPGCLYKTSVVAAFFKEAITKGTITIEGTGAQTRDFVHIDDVVRAIKYASESDFQGRLDIASSTSLSIYDLAYKILALTGAKLQYTKERPNEVYDVSVDNSEAREVLGWKPMANLDNELAIIYGYYLDHVDTPFAKHRKAK